MNKPGLKIIAIVILYMTSLSVFAQKVVVVKNNTGYIIDVYTNTVEFLRISPFDSIPKLKDATYIYEKGAPELPKITKRFNLENADSFLVEILDSSYSDWDVSVAASKGFISANTKKEERKYLDKFKKNRYFPNQLTESKRPFNLRKRNEQALWIQPLHYNYATRKLRVYHHIKIQLTKIENSPKIVLKSQRAEPENTPISLCVVATEKMKEALQPFLAWKNQLGYQVMPIYIPEGLNHKQVKSHIQQLYNLSHFQYLLLVGDHEDIPAYPSIYGPSDYSYGLLANNDNVSEVSIGRFPARTESELKSMTEKTIQYEMYQTPNNKILSFAGIASKEGDGGIGDKGETDLKHILNIETLLNSNNFSSTISSEGDLKRKLISHLFNNGCNYMAYVGHGNEDRFSSITFTKDSIQKLKNYSQHPVLIDAACLNGNFKVPKCFAETLLTASDSIGNKGCVAALASSISQLWAPPMLGQDKFFEYLLSHNDTSKHIHIGNVCNEVFLDIWSAYGNGGLETVYTWVLFGDPTLTLANTIPSEISTLAPDLIDISNDTLRVPATDGVMVTLQNRFNSVFKTVSEHGLATLIPGVITNIDSIALTYTKPQHKPLVKYLSPYSSNSSFYSIKRTRVYDDNNSIPENDEWIYADYEITNHGEITGQNLKLTLTTDTLLKTWRNTFTIDSISAGDNYSIKGISVRSNTDCEDLSVGKYHISVEDDLNQKNAKSFTQEICAPIVTLNEVSIANRVGSNVLKSDTLTVQCVLKNSGHAPAHQLSVFSYLQDIYVHNLTSNQLTTNLEANKSDTLVFKLKISTNCPEGYLLKGQIYLGDKASTPLPFSCYYKRTPNAIYQGKGASVSEYPFYNYYLANRTQFVFSRDELSSMSIDSIGFYFQYTSSNANLRTFKNFSLKVQEVQSVSSLMDFKELSSPTILLQSESYTIPRKEGWIFFDTKDYHYSNNNALLFDITWGLNNLASSYNDAFKITTHQTNFNSVVYGFNDFQNSPQRNGFSTMRPDVYFAYGLEELNSVSLTIHEDLFTTDTDTFRIQMGEKQFYLGESDSLTFDLLNGDYELTYTNVLGESRPFNFKVVENNQGITIGQPNHLGSINSDQSTLNCFIANNEVHISVPHEKTSRFLVTLYTISGQIIYKSKVHNSGTIKIPVSKNNKLIIVNISSETMHTSKLLSK